MATDSEFPGFELSGDFLTITASTPLKIATWIAKDFDSDKTKDSRFVWLGHLAETFIKSEELEARYGFKANKATWLEDLKLDKAQCKLWQRYGGELLPKPGDPPHQVFSQITAILPPSIKFNITQWKNYSKAGRSYTLREFVYDEYSNIWERIAGSANGFSKAYTTSGLSDFNFRFYQGPITPPVDIVFSPLVDWIDAALLRELFEVVLHEAQKKSRTWPDSFNVSTLSKDDADKSSTLVTFSVNPFGYFRTLISPEGLIRLVNAQIEAAEAGEPRTDWIHAFPPPDKVEEADKTMKKLPNPPVPKQQTFTSIAFKKSTRGAQVRLDRKKPLAIMGGLSANKWALNDLGWKLSQSNSNDTVAEWLHRSASSLRALGGAVNDDPDVRPNLMFGTQETNTNMIRSESAIKAFHSCASELSLDPKVCNGELKTEVLGTSGIVKVLRPDGKEDNVTVPPELVWGPATTATTATAATATGYLWLVPELEYTIRLTAKYSMIDISVLHTTTFQPFHRKPALRPEASLDNKVMHYFFDHAAIGDAPVIKKLKT
ncbi:hypothetical protein BGW80DRAFT_1414286 [Lactifluus volemus]|nr:hypothetical protein BGW80DRAFT_1414286 [Lactifluus volemus]